MPLQKAGLEIESRAGPVQVGTLLAIGGCLLHPNVDLEQHCLEACEFILGKMKLNGFRSRKLWAPHLQKLVSEGF